MSETMLSQKILMMKNTEYFYEKGKHTTVFMCLRIFATILILYVWENNSRPTGNKVTNTQQKEAYNFIKKMLQKQSYCTTYA